MKTTGSNTFVSRTITRAGLLLLLPCLGVAQSRVATQAKPSAAIPATSPTSSVSDLPSAHPPLTNTVHGLSKVTWDGTQLTIQGNGDSLRNILREISRQTGMKVTGGVPGDLVFGTYGPSSAQVVFAQLFDGMPLNMILINGSPSKPRELQLTARTGAASPPNTQPMDAASGDEPTNSSATQPPVRTPNGEMNAPQAAQQPGANSAIPPVPVGLPQDGNGVAPAQNTDSSEQPQSPNGVRTPEQIFEELRRRQAATANQPNQ